MDGSELRLFMDIEEILDGIDKTECDDGWWPTSVGSQFGAMKLKEIKDMIYKYYVVTQKTIK